LQLKEIYWLKSAKDNIFDGISKFADGRKQKYDRGKVKNLAEEGKNRYNQQKKPDLKPGPFDWPGPIKTDKEPPIWFKIIKVLAELVDNVTDKGGDGIF
jgi:hypothetical protein